MLPRSTRCPHQRHVYADGLCSKLTACVYAVTSLKLKQSKGKSPSGLSVSSMAWVGSIWGWFCLNNSSLKRRACPAYILCKWPSSKGKGQVIERFPEECPSACLTWLYLSFRKSPLFGGNEAGTLFQISGISLSRIWMPMCLWRDDLCLRNLIPTDFRGRKLHIIKSVFQNHSETSLGARYFMYYSLDNTYIWWQWTETGYDKVRSGLNLF